MSSEIRDREGKLLATVKTSKDAKKEADFNMALIAIAILLVIIMAPFLPILAPAYILYTKLMESGVHELFSVLIALSPVVISAWLLIRFQIIRLVYFQAVTLGSAAIVFHSVQGNADTIWAGFWALVTLAVGTAISVKLFKLPALTTLSALRFLVKPSK